MRWKPVVSVALSVVSIGAQEVGLSCAYSGAIIARKGGHVDQTVASVGGAASTLAIVLALLALGLAVISWPKERSWVRVSALCLAVGALLWSFVMV